MAIEPTASRVKHEHELEVVLTGQELLEQPLLNKGTAFSQEERHELGLLGLLPPHVEDMQQQVSRCYEAFGQQVSDLEKHVYLRNLQDENETLFYRFSRPSPRRGVICRTSEWSCLAPDQPA